MKLLVISDSHDNIVNIKHIMGFAEKVHVEGVIHCGDWDNVESVETILSYKIPLYAVAGNADIDHEVEESLKFGANKFDPYFLKFEVDGRKIGVVHEARWSDKKFEGLDVVFSGHYHSKSEKMVNFTKFVRPGAVVNGFNFAIYETITNNIEFINEENEQNR